jgi:hypothetical protein
MLKNSAAAVAARSRVSAGQGKGLREGASGSRRGEPAAAAASQPSLSPLLLLLLLLSPAEMLAVQSLPAGSRLVPLLLLAAAPAAACASTALSTKA